MKFAEALPLIAAQLDLDPAELQAYADEDTIPGSLDGPSDQPGRNPYGIPYTADGKLLYALVRALKPEMVLESGCNHGGSAVHIASALKANGEGGLLVTVDIWDGAGQHIPQELAPHVRVIHADIREWAKTTNFTAFQFVHEDASHESDTVYAVYANLHRLASYGAVVLSHDTALGVGEYIRSAINGAGFPVPPHYLYDESPCGFSIMRYGGVYAAT